MHKIKLIMVDLDGTILIDHKNISDQTEEMLNKLLEAGVEVVPTTGRYYHTIPDYFKNHDKINYVVSSNGAVITNNREDIYQKTISSDIVIDVLKQADTLTVSSSIATKDGIVIDREKFSDNPFINKEFKKSLEDKTILVDNLLHYYQNNQEDVKKIQLSFENLIFRNDLHAKFSKIEMINTVSSAHDNIEITAKGASKGLALHTLKNHLNLDTNQVLAIGDSENDISMLNEAGISVAMGNASDKVKAVSTMITASNQDDGFAKAIKKVFNF